jgi:hypothetical protein
MWLDKSRWIGVAGGFGLFLIFILFLTWQNSDFDHRLVNAVESGKPNSELKIQIENETVKMKISAKKQLESRVLNSQYWSTQDLASVKDFNYDRNYYNDQIHQISEYEKFRKDYVDGKISKNEFLDRSPSFKESIGV